METTKQELEMAVAAAEEAVKAANEALKQAKATHETAKTELYYFNYPESFTSCGDEKQIENRMEEDTLIIRVLSHLCPCEVHINRTSLRRGLQLRGIKKLIVELTYMGDGRLVVPLDAAGCPSNKREEYQYVSPYHTSLDQDEHSSREVDDWIATGNSHCSIFNEERVSVPTDCRTLVSIDGLLEWRLLPEHDK